MKPADTFVATNIQRLGQPCTYWFLCKSNQAIVVQPITFLVSSSACSRDSADAGTGFASNKDEHETTRAAKAVDFTYNLGERKTPMLSNSGERNCSWDLGGTGHAGLYMDEL
jgi:hypothetical protein